MVTVAHVIIYAVEGRGYDVITDRQVYYCVLYTSTPVSYTAFQAYHFTINFCPVYAVLEIRIRDWSAVFFLKIGYFLGYWLLSHWKCTGNLANQNEFFSSKCWNCLENSQWLTVVSITGMCHTMCYDSLWYHHRQWCYNYGMVECYSDHMVTWRVTR